MIDLDTLRSKFISSYANIPQNLRRDVIVVLDKEIYSWQTAFYEIKEKTKIGDNILKELNDLGLI